MTFLRFLGLTTTAGIGGYVFAEVAAKWRQALLKVNAQPQAQVAESKHLALEDKTETTETTETTVRPPPRRFIPYNKGGPVFPHPEVANRTVLEYKDFVLCYDNQTRTANWTLEHITEKNCQPLTEFPPTNRSDCRIPQQFRTNEEDFRSALAKFQQQLLAPMDLHPSDVKDPCVYTNVVPQTINGCKGKVTTTVWNELHDYTVHLTKYHPNIYVLTGSLYLPTCKPDGKWVVQYEIIGHKNVAIPSHFFKVILAENPGGCFRLECFKFENKLYENKDLRQFHVSRCDLEKDAGISIFQNVHDNRIKDGELEKHFIEKRYTSPPSPPLPQKY